MLNETEELRKYNIKRFNEANRKRLKLIEKELNLINKLEDIYKRNNL